MTNKTWMAACSAIVGCATMAMAQTPAPPQSATPSSDREITITGCLMPTAASSAAAAPTGTTGTTGAPTTAGTSGTAGETANAAATFQLTNATVAPPDSAATAAAPAASETANAPAGQTYRLIANPTGLSPHVGKKLALTGTLEAADTTTASTAPGSEAKGPAFRVKSGKVIAESCTQ